MRGLEEQMDYGQQYEDWGDWRNRTWIVDSNVGDDGLWPTIRRLEVCVFVCLFVPTRAVLKGLTLGKFAFDVCVCMVWFTFV